MVKPGEGLDCEGLVHEVFFGSFLPVLARSSYATGHEESNVITL